MEIDGARYAFADDNAVIKLVHAAGWFAVVPGAPTLLRAVECNWQRGRCPDSRLVVVLAEDGKALATCELAEDGKALATCELAAGGLAHGAPVDLARCRLLVTPESPAYSPASPATIPRPRLRPTWVPPPQPDFPLLRTGEGPSRFARLEEIRRSVSVPDQVLALPTPDELALECRNPTSTMRDCFVYFWDLILGSLSDSDRVAIVRHVLGSMQPGGQHDAAIRQLLLKFG
jgi:hypothetical protein